MREKVTFQAGLDRIVVAINGPDAEGVADNVRKEALPYLNQTNRRYFSDLAAHIEDYLCRCACLVHVSESTVSTKDGRGTVGAYYLIKAMTPTLTEPIHEVKS